jgi:hypothetical protein
VNRLIRASYLPMYADCSRRQAARMWPDLLLEHGYTIRELEPSIAAAVGTATHASMAHMLEAKRDQGVLPPADDSVQAGIQRLGEETGSGVVWDDTSPNLNTAQQQVRRQTLAYRAYAAPTIQVMWIEQRFELDTGGGNILSGQIDVGDGGVRDLKTGITTRPNAAQYGAYSILLRTYDHPVSHVIEDYVPRVRITKEQPPPRKIEYDRELAEHVATNILRRVERDLKEFEKTGRPDAFLANPSSMLCAAKWCPAHSTPFCREHR